MLYEPLFVLVAVRAKVMYGRNRAHWRVLMGRGACKERVGRKRRDEGGWLKVGDHLKQTVLPGPTCNSTFLNRV